MHFLLNVEVSFDTSCNIFLNLTTSSEIQTSYWHFKHHVLHLIRWLVNQPLIAGEREGRQQLFFSDVIRQWLNFMFETFWIYLIAASWSGILIPGTAGAGASEKKKKHLQDSSSVCPCSRLGSLSDPHAGQCLNPWGIWFDFLYHLHYTELRVNIVELKWRLMFCYWCVSIKGRHEVKAEWVYLSYWERLHILNHLEQHFTEKTWNSSLI